MSELVQNSLAEALKNAATRQLSAEELHRQRVSFVMGSFKDSDTVTHARVDEVLSNKAGYVEK